MNGNGWSDVAYNMLVCKHGYVFMGRGPKVLTAANGPGLNSQHYSVCALVGTSGDVQPTDDMLNGIRDAIQYLRVHGNAGREIKGHRDGYATSCPGDALYAWVRRGAPRPKATSTPTPVEPTAPDNEDDEMPTYISLGLDSDNGLSIPRAEWTPFAFNHEYADPENQHSSGLNPSFLTGKAYFVATVTGTVTGLLPGVVFSVRCFEVDKDNEERTKTYATESFTAIADATPISHTVVGTVDAGSKVRVEVYQAGAPEGVRLRDPAVKCLYWRP
jgi:hypothetical protein